MEAFLDILCHGRKLQSATKNLSDAEIRTVIEKLENIINKRVEKRLATEKAEQEKRQKIEQIYKQMEEAGLDISDFQSTDTQFLSSKMRQKRKIKYVYQSGTEQEVKWSGVGKMPKVFAEAIANGQNLDEFKVELDVNPGDSLDNLKQ